LRVESAGSVDGAEGNISIMDSTETDTYAYVKSGNNMAMMAIWNVPAGMTAYLTSWWGSVKASMAMEYRLRVKEFGKVWVTRRHLVVPSGEGYFGQQLDFPIPIAEKSDILIEAKGTGSDVIVTAGFNGEIRINES